LFINNNFVPSLSGKKFESINPTTGKPITRVYEADKLDVDRAVEAAKRALLNWKKVSPTEKGALMLKLADLMEKNQTVLSELESIDNGKVVSVSSSIDVPYAIETIRYYAGWANKIHGKTMNVNDQFQTYTRLEPFGVVGQIIPWNFPLLMLAWKWGPALATGNTIVMKTSEKTPLSALKMCELVVEAGFPPGVINVLSGFGPTAGNAMASHPDISKIAFTGSTLVGRKILEASAQSNLKKVSLELGGKSPNIIFKDADLDAAVNWASVGIFFNHGQVCTAGSRVFVHEDIYDAFVEKFKAKAGSIRVGDPLLSQSEHGPLVDKIQYDRVLHYIKDGVDAGATCEVGGCHLGTEGYFVAPTLFTNVHDSMKIAREEIFGPVVVAMKFKTVEEVIARANDTNYGLAAAIHTNDMKLATKVINELAAGTVWVNCYNTFFHQMPFGGFKVIFCIFDQR
jgi:aldehyde dehydrogenase (NAD+)